MAVKPIWLFFVLVLCWRYLGTEGYGVFSTALWLAYIPASLTELGLTQLTMRDVARNRSEASTYFSNLFAFRVGVAPVAWLVALGLGLVFNYGSAMMIALSWAGVYAVGMSAAEYQRAYYRAFENLRWEAISTVAEKTLVVGLGSTALLIERTAQMTLAGMAAGMTISVCLNAIWISGRLARFRVRAIDFTFLKKSLRAALPLGLYSLFIVFYHRIGGVLLEEWHGPTIVGHFAGAYRIVEALFLLTSLYLAAVLPRLSSLFHENKTSSFRSVFARSILSATAVAILTAATLAFFAGPIIHLVNPDPSAGATAGILRLLVWVFPLITLKDLLIIGLIASDQQRYLAVALGASAALNVAFNFLLTYPLAAEGLIGSLALTELTIICLLAFRMRGVLKEFGSPPLRESEGSLTPSGSDGTHAGAQSSHDGI